MWKANGKTTTLQLFLDGLSPKTEKLSLEGTMDLSRDRLILELELFLNCHGEKYRHSDFTGYTNFEPPHEYRKVNLGMSSVYAQFCTQNPRYNGLMRGGGRYFK
jgi:hypothetical protein